MCESIIVLFLWVMLGLTMVIATIAVLLNTKLCQKIQLLQESLITHSDAGRLSPLQKRIISNISQKSKMTIWQWLRVYILKTEAHINQRKDQLRKLLQ